MCGELAVVLQSPLKTANACTLHPVGQPQNLAFPQHYALVPSAAPSHALGHIAPLCSRCLLTVSLTDLHGPLGSGSWLTDSSYGWLYLHTH